VSRTILVRAAERVEMAEAIDDTDTNTASTRESESLTRAFSVRWMACAAALVSRDATEVAVDKLRSIPNVLVKASVTEVVDVRERKRERVVDSSVATVVVESRLSILSAVLLMLSETVAMDSRLAI
jgi:hypothetical protein